MNTFLKAVALLRLACQHRKEIIKLPYSNWTLQLIQILYREGYLTGYSTQQSRILVELKYYRNQPCLTHLKIHSKPSQRIYLKAYQIQDLNPFNGLGFSLISTNLGVLTHIQAQQFNVGGELILSFF